MAGLFKEAERADLAKAAKIARENFTKVYEEIYGNTMGKYGIDTEEAAFKQFIRFSGLNGVPRVDSRDSASPELEAFKPRSLTVRFHSYRGKWGYLDEDARDDQWNYFKQVASTIGEAAAYQLETIGAEFLNLAADTSATGGWDSKSLLHPAHDNDNGTTYSNVSAPLATLEEKVNAALKYFDAVPDAHGRPVPVARKVFIVHTTKRRELLQILGSKTAVTLVPAQGGNLSTGTVNPNPQIRSQFMDDLGDIRVISTPYLDNALADQFIALGEGHEVFFLWNMKPTTKFFETTDPDTTWQRIWFKVTTGWLDARKVFGVQAA